MENILNDTQSLKSGIAENLNPGWDKFQQTYRDKHTEDQANRETIDKDYVAWLDSDLRRCVTQYDFDPECRPDGVAYAHAVAACVKHGPLSEHSAQQYQQDLSDDPTDVDNIQIRALLGNQSAFFQWTTDANVNTAIYREIADLFALNEVATVGGYAGLAPHGVAALANPILGSLGATAALLDKDNALNAELRAFVERVVTGVVGSSQDGQVALVKIRQVPLQLLVEGWHERLDSALNQVKTQTKKHGEDLVLASAGVIGKVGGNELGSKSLDVYVWTTEKAEALGRSIARRGQKGSEYVIEAATTNLNKAWHGVSIATDASGVKKLLRNSARLIANGDVTLAMGAGLLDALLLPQAMRELTTTTGSDKRDAEFALATHGLGVISASFDVAGRGSRALATRAARGGTKTAMAAAEAAGSKAIAVGGVLAGGATIISAVQAYISAVDDFQTNDEDAGYTHVAEAAFLGVGGLALGFGALPSALPVFGFSLTGWGLVLVALGLIASFIAALLEDGPAATWAARSIWGKGSDAFGTPTKEQLALNQMLLGVRISFVRDDHATRHALADPRIGGVAAAMDPYWDVHFTLRFATGDAMPWGYEIYGIQNDGTPVRLAQLTHGLSFPGRVVQTADGAEVHTLERSGGRIHQAITLTHSAFKSARAAVTVYDDPTSETPTIQHVFKLK